MKKALLIVAMLLTVSQVMAGVTITATQEGTYSTPDGNVAAIIRVSYTGDQNVRAFALDVNVDSGCNFWNIRDFNVGENSFGNKPNGYGIFPGRFRQFVNPSNPDPCYIDGYPNGNYNPTPPWADPGTTNTGIGFPEVIVEMGYLGAGDVNMPAQSGTLFRIDVNGYSAGDANLTLVADAMRGGIVSKDTNSTITATLVGTKVHFKPIVTSHTIAGNAGVAGATMSGLTGNPVSDGSGNYTATVADGFSGTVTPTLACYTFSPVSKTYTNVTSDQLGQNYTATANTYTISGRVVGANPPKDTAGISGVVMSGLPGNPVTNSTGNYTVTVPCGWSGTCTPTDPNAGQWSFSSASSTYTNVTSNQTQNYTGTALECLNALDPGYAAWKASPWNKPACWCNRRQCRGDSGGTKVGFWVYTSDLNLLKSTYGKSDAALAAITNGICADADHTKVGFRVYTGDLNIIKSYYGKADAAVPECNLAPIIVKVNKWNN